ncbi:MAG TPA: FAD binding domain-containing protein [Bacteroidia bacterium]|nr:FAD binding domain-containing protein [Bacteroidia bacterium]
MIEFILNNKYIKTGLPAGMTVLDFVRYEQNLKGTKIGCREGDCGACTVLAGELKENKLQYISMTSCLMPLGNASGKHIVTVEGINLPELNPVQKAIVDEGGTQCGFCTVGFVMSLAGFCLSEKETNYENAIASIDGNICRCTGYKSLERASASIVQQLKSRNSHEIISWLIKEKFIPSYFSEIPKRLLALSKSQNGVSKKIKIGGGTDLYVQQHDSMVHADADFVFDNAALKGIHQNENLVYLGASTTVEDIRGNNLMNKFFPRLKKQLKLISSTPIRNMATLAGNFVNASPIGDMTIFFLALNAGLVLNYNGKKREILLKDFYKGYKTIDKSEDEIIETIFFEIPKQHTYFNFEKVSKRTHLDIASVNSAINLELSGNKMLNVHAATGGVFAFPRYLEKTSAYLNGKEISASAVLSAGEILQTEVSPISDARGSQEYKRLLARQLFFAHFIEIFPGKIKAEELFENTVM